MLVAFAIGFVAKCTALLLKFLNIHSRSVVVANLAEAKVVDYCLYC